jgi:tyrosyl-tRNA synthetase
LLATPLITDSHGQKFGKSEGNAVWLSPEMTSPYAFYQYWLGVEDASVGQLLRVFTDRGPDEIADLERQTAERPQARAGQRVLAGDVTTLVHGAAATDAAIAASAALFGRGDLASVDEPTLRAALTEAGLHQVSGEVPTVAALLVAAGLVKSLSEARRVVAEGGASVNNVRVGEADHVPVADELLHGRYLVLRRGKRSVAGIELGAGSGSAAETDIQA